MNQINDRSLSGAPPKCATPSCNNRILSLLEPIPVYCPTCIQRQQEVDPEAMTWRISGIATTMIKSGG